MSENSPRLSLPLMQQGQAQKHVTHNEALELLDVLVQLTVQGFDALVPPGEAAEGEIWALGAAPVDAWAGQAGCLAAWANGGWLFVTPKRGWRAASGDEVRVWTGAAWVFPRLPELDDLPGLGVNAVHDTENRLAVAAPAVLLSHAGDDHRVKVNKAAAGDTASVVFQSGFAGRAEMGLAGSDDFVIKVSSDGTTWHTALSVDAATGSAHLKAGAMIGGQGALHRGNVLGAVAQTGGIPTGAVIERGTNANGEYVRFADGTQICQRRVDVDVESTAFQQFNFPAGFVTTPAMAWSHAGSAPNPALQIPNIEALAPFSLNWTVKLFAAGTSDNPNSNPERMWLMAIGRWF